MIILHPDNKRATTISFDEFREQLISAYADHKKNVKIKNAKGRVTQEDVNFAVSWWISELPRLFTESLDNGQSTIIISYCTYPDWSKQTNEYLANLVRKGFPICKKILDGMGIMITNSNLEVSFPTFHIDIETVKRFINSDLDVIEEEL